MWHTSFCQSLLVNRHMSFWLNCCWRLPWQISVPSFCKLSELNLRLSFFQVARSICAFYWSYCYEADTSSDSPHTRICFSHYTCRIRQKTLCECPTLISSDDCQTYPRNFPEKAGCHSEHLTQFHWWRQGVTFELTRLNICQYSLVTRSDSCQVCHGTSYRALLPNTC